MNRKIFLLKMIIIVNKYVKYSIVNTNNLMKFLGSKKSKLVIKLQELN